MPDYTSTQNLKTVYDRIGHCSPVQYQDKECFLKWRGQARDRLRSLLALESYELCESLPCSYDTTDISAWYKENGRAVPDKYDGLVRERVILQTEPDVWMPFFLLHDGMPGKKPAAIIPSACGGGKFTFCWSEDYEVFRGETEPALKKLLEARWAFTAGLARAGFLVAVMDIRGEGERREWMDQGEEKFFSTSHRPVNNTAIALGRNLAGMSVWEISRIIDYLETRQDVSGRFAVMGEKEGGFLALLASACDKRICTAADSGWWMSFRNSLIPSGLGSACAHVPFLWQYFDMADIAAMTYSAALLIRYSDRSPLNRYDEGDAARMEAIVSSISEYTKAEITISNGEEEPVFGQREAGLMKRIL